MSEPTPWPHFSRHELECHCGCRRMEMDPEFMQHLEDLRLLYGKPMQITSGFRCPEHNEHASTTGLAGPHTTGKAVDIRIAGAEAHQLLALAITHGFTGIGVSQKGSMNNRFLHLDTIKQGPGRPRPTIWNY